MIHDSQITIHEPRIMNHKPRITIHEPKTTILKAVHKYICIYLYTCTKTTNHKPQTTIHESRSTNKENKPNFLDAQMNVSSSITMNYEQITMNNANKNKPNQTQFQTGPAISINNSSQHLPQNSAQGFVNLDISLLFGSKSLCPRSGPKKKHQNNDIGNQGNCQTYRH